MRLCSVHMTPVYGKGHNAFTKIQLEILSKSDDGSIFAWIDKSDSEGHEYYSPPLLPPSESPET